MAPRLDAKATRVHDRGVRPMEPRAPLRRRTSARGKDVRHAVGAAAEPARARAGGFLAALLLAPGLVLAQTDQGGAANPFKPEQLEQLVAPIALYPDPLLAQVLMASTYPLEIVQAARFVKANPNLKGDQLNEALKKQTWDDSVKSLVVLPPGPRP